MLKNEIDETITETESTQDDAELNEGELKQAAGGLNFTRAPKKPAVDMF